MSNVIGATSFGQKPNAKAPDKGSFPLDHDGECKDFMKLYMQCLKEKSRENTLCRKESMEYLNCRMEKNLMRKEPWKMLGYNDLVQEKKTTN